MYLVTHEENLRFQNSFNQERPVRLFHLVFYKFTKLKNYISVFNIRER